jgi:hypothetical protein
MQELPEDEPLRRLAEIQTELVERCRTENDRHNAALAQYRAEFRAKILALQAEFAAKAA